MTVTSNIKWKKLIVCVAIPLIVGGLSALISKSGFEKYAEMPKPALSPPSWLFPVVWTILYVLMGIASYRIFTAEGDMTKRKNALIFYGIQLFFNFAWTIVFFNFGLYLFAFIWLVVMWALIIVTMLKFYKIDKKAGFLILPYLLWVTFAGYLNFGVFLLN